MDIFILIILYKVEQPHKLLFIVAQVQLYEVQQLIKRKNILMLLRLRFLAILNMLETILNLHLLQIMMS